MASARPAPDGSGTAAPDGRPARGPTIFICAGEASGDHHGAALARALKARDPSVRLIGLGGPAMIEAGVEVPFDFVAHAAMGLFPVLRKLGFFRRTLAETIARVAAERPDVVVPIDYPGFNLRLARGARKAGIPVAYYVSPQVWAWAPWRVKKIARAVDHMLVLFPFEKAFYDRHGVACTHVGHPIFDVLRAEKKTPAFRAELVGAAPHEPVVGLLPGSRAQEIERNLPLELAASKLIFAEQPDAKFVVPVANAAHRALVESIVAREASGLPLKVLDGHARDVGRVSRVVIVTSGTATLEMLWYEVPMVIVYAINRLEAAFRVTMMHTPYIGLVNILADREAVPEFVDYHDRTTEVAERALDLIRDGRERKRTISRLRALKEEVAALGASDRAADAVLALARAHRA